VPVLAKGKIARKPAPSRRSQFRPQVLLAEVLARLSDNSAESPRNPDAESCLTKQGSDYLALFTGYVLCTVDRDSVHTQ
jgi:hypothetical protein